MGSGFASATYQHNSPSDLLWSQMKRQLNMRENLRSKKQELEELIQNENRVVIDEEEEGEGEDEEDISAEKEEDNEDNKIVNCYRDFLLKNKLSFGATVTSRQHEVDSPEERHNDSDDDCLTSEDEEEIIMKR